MFIALSILGIGSSFYISGRQNDGFIPSLPTSAESPKLSAGLTVVPEGTPGDLPGVLRGPQSHEAYEILELAENGAQPGENLQNHYHDGQPSGIHCWT